MVYITLLLIMNACQPSTRVSHRKDDLVLGQIGQKQEQ